MTSFLSLSLERVKNSALAFRGYNVTNLGRTGELLEVDAYRQIVTEELRRFSAICEREARRPVDLLDFVQRGEEPDLDHYSEAIALVVATEMAQIRLLKEVHGVDYARVKHSFGYSLGELSAVCCGGVFDVEDLVRVPLAMAEDSVRLSEGTRMGVLFSRGPAIAEANVDRLCVTLSSEGKGTIGISAVLSPNTYLLIGQNQTVQRFKQQMHELLPHKAHLRMNPDRWPPLHTPIVRQCAIPDRASVMMERLPGGVTPPSPPVVSLVTGKRSYDDHSGREVLRHWVDRPQRLWDAICATLAAGVETVIHVGPEPNVIPATFSRLAENVQQQTGSNTIESYRLRAVAGLARRSWLSALLPSRASLLRAPYVQQIILEDWLIENAPR